MFFRRRSRLSVICRRYLGSWTNPLGGEALAGWIKQDDDPDRGDAILAAIAKQPPALVRSLGEETILTRRYEERNQFSALEIFVHGLDESNEARLLEIAERLEDGPVVANVLTELGHRSRTGKRIARHRICRPDCFSAFTKESPARMSSPNTSRVEGVLLSSCYGMLDSKGRSSSWLTARSASSDPFGWTTTPST